MILVTHPTGFAGRAIVRQLVAGDREVRCRLQPSRRELKLPTGISFSTVSASMDDLPALRTALQDVAAVVHLMGEEDLVSETTLARHVQQTSNLTAAMQEADVRRVAYLSRMGAGLASAYPLLRIQGQAEEIVRGSGLDYTILRPTLIYGPEGAFTNVLAMLAKAIPLVLPIPDTGLSRFRPLWIEDLARCVSLTLDRTDLIGETTPLGGPEHFTLEQILTEILAAMNIRRLMVRLRMPIVRGVSRLMDHLLPRSPTPMWLLDILALGDAGDLGTIPHHFGFKPQRFAQGLDHLRRKRPWRRELIRFILCVE